MIRGLIISIPCLAIAACMADEGAGSTTGDQEASRGEPDAAAQAAATQTVAWTAATVDRAEAISPDACARLVSFNDSSCPSGFVCMWQNAGRLGFGVAESDGAGCRINSMTNVPCVAGGIARSCPHGNGTFNDEMSSWWNNTAHQSCWFFNAGFTGKAVLMTAHTFHNSVESDNNDKASSQRPASEGC
jgi:hypothetical protein